MDDQQQRNILKLFYIIFNIKDKLSEVATNLEEYSTHDTRFDEDLQLWLNRGNAWDFPTS